MNTTKTALISNTIQLLLTRDLYQFKNTCLDLRRLIVEMPASSAKEKLLFYIDACIHIDTYFCLEDVKNNIEQMRSIIYRVSVVSRIERYLLYLNDIFITIYRKNSPAKTARFKREYH